MMHLGMGYAKWKKVLQIQMILSLKENLHIHYNNYTYISLLFEDHLCKAKNVAHECIRRLKRNNNNKKPFGPAANRIEKVLFIITEE